jgi:hypothetical protein
MSIRDQAITVLHRTIPNPMITRAQTITTVPGHTIPNPMGIRAQVGKWLPVIAETLATESKAGVPVPNKVIYTPGAPPEPTSFRFADDC